MTKQIIALLLILQAINVASVPSAGAEEEKDTFITYAINTFGTSFKLEDPVNIGVAIINNGEKIIYLWGTYKGLEGLAHLVIYDANGNEVPTGAIPTPPDHPPLMEHNGIKIAVDPIWEISPKDGKVYICEDCIKYYKSNMVPGDYVLALKESYVFSCEREELIEKHGELWIQTSKRCRTVKISEANQIRISIEGK